MIEVKIKKESNKKRLDFCLSEMLPDISRNQLKRYIEEGCVFLVNNNPSLAEGSNLQVADLGAGNKYDRRSRSEIVQEYATELRNNPTTEEKKLWKLLSKKQTGYNFRRQYNIDNKYILDFVCLEKKLVIELDGSQHVDSEKDVKRTEYLKSQGFEELRFWNNEVNSNLNGCYEKIISALSLPRPRNADGISTPPPGRGIVCVTSPSHKVKTGEEYSINIPEIKEATPEAQNIPLNIVYEDDDVLVINKEAGMVVHPAAGNYDGTLVNAILYHCKDSLSGIGGVQRPGIVHRLDKDTSGLMIVAKNDKAHNALSKQLETRKLSRIYNAIVWGNPSPTSGEISTNIGRSKSNRQKMSVLGEDSGKEAITYYRTLRTFSRKLCLVECKLQTGRTHQIRVHMTHIGCPLLGDQIYGRSKLSKFKFDDKIKTMLKEFPRQALHAKEISFIHPTTKEEMSFSSELPEDMQKIIEILE